MKSYKNSKRDDRSREIDVYQHTCRYIDQHPSLQWKDGVSVCESFFFGDIPIPPPFNKTPSILVENTDTLSMAELFAQRGGGVCVLNMASDFKPGGGVARGARSQEENMARRSNLVEMLDVRHYPLHRTAMLYSSPVTVFKDASYNVLPQFFDVSVISCAAIRNPKLNKEGVYHEDQRALMLAKIRGMIHLAIHVGAKRLVLGAFGCGAFNNPPRQVAALFAQCLMKEQLACCFEEVGFAVLVGRAGEEENYTAFQQAFLSK